MLPNVQGFEVTYQIGLRSYSVVLLTEEAVKKCVALLLQRDRPTVVRHAVISQETGKVIARRPAIDAALWMAYQQAEVA